ncbi:hypothetical protein Tco_0045601 [Tanacetum coccineum]
MEKITRWKKRLCLVDDLKKLKITYKSSSRNKLLGLKDFMMILKLLLLRSQRSKECPICWQAIVLKDPARLKRSQELLSMVEDERSMRSVADVRHVNEDPEVDHDVEYNDSDFEEQLMRTFEAAATSMRYSSRRNKQRLSGIGPSRVHPRANRQIEQEMYTSLEDFHSLGYASSHDNLDSSSSRSMSSFIDQNSPSVGSSASRPRVVNSPSPTGSPGRPIAADMHAFSESVKSKLSAASAKYKESISKSTQGLKAKLLAKDSPVKELSRGVQREMSAGFAGVARMFNRFDPTLKRTTPSSNNDGLTKIFKGKSSQDNVLASPLNEHSADTARNVSSNVETMNL